LFIEWKITSKISDVHVLFDDKVITKRGNTNKFVSVASVLSDYITQYFQSDFLPVYCQNKKINIF